MRQTWSVLVLCLCAVGCGTDGATTAPGGGANGGNGRGAASDGGSGGDATTPTDASHPNVLLVIADDFGLDASPCHTLGASKPSMPTVSKLCAQGVVFDNAWATPECSPSRATLMTGQYGFRTHVGAAGDPLAVTTPTLQQQLKTGSAHYANAIIGKWHLGGSTIDPTQPAQLGVDHYEGLFNGALKDYYAWTKVQSDGSQVAVTDYATSVFADDAISWLATAQGPWFLWLAFTAPHTPFHLPPSGFYTDTSLSGSAADIQANPLPYYLAAAEALDHELTRVLDSLPAATLANTVVIFLGDNGTPPQTAQSPYSRLSAKGTLYDGGVHVPLVVANAGVTRVGARESALVQTEDVFATILDLAGVGPLANTDGLSFKSLLTQAQSGVRSTIYSEFFRGGTAEPMDDATAFGWTVRNDRYQLVHRDAGLQLFDLVADPGASTDLLTQKPVPSAASTTADELEKTGTALRGE